MDGFFRFLDLRGWVVPGLCLVGFLCHRLDADSVNWALNRPYEISPPPNYTLCTDPGDSVQLTDGHALGSDWRKESTVGWRTPEGFPMVVIDLGSNRAVDIVRVHTVGGGRSGVFFPSYLWVGASEDGTTYSPAGWATTLNRKQDRTRSPNAPRVSEVVEIETMGTRGRFVLIAAEANSDYVFIDEIEVVGTSGLAPVTPQPAGVTFGQRDLGRVFKSVRTHSFLVADLLATCSQAAQNASPLDEEVVNAFRRRLDDAPWGDEQGLQQLRSELGKLRGSSQRATTRMPWVAWVSQTALLPSPTEFVFSGQQVSGQIQTTCWEGEYESAVISLANTGEQDLLVRADVSAIRLGDGTVLAAEHFAELRHAVWVESRGMGRIADALVRVTDDGFEIPAGGMSQIWLTLNADAVPAGKYEFAVRIFAAPPSEWSTASVGVVPGELHVHPLRMPETLSVSSCNWAYVGHTRTLQTAPDDAMSDLIAHYTNTFVTHRTSFPQPSRSEDGRADYSRLDDELARLGGARTLLLFWGLGSSHRSLSELGVVGSAEWKSRTTKWLRAWIDHLKRSGWTYDRFAMYPYDEYLGPEFLALAKLIKEEIDPNVRIFANHRGKEGSGEFASIAPYIDIWCLPDTPVTEMRQPLKSPRPGTQFWTYATNGPGKANPPYSYYRLQPWRAFARGESGCGFWAYSDARDPESTSAWNDYSKPQGWYSVVYGAEGSPVSSGGESLIPSRRWEAWRDGLEDFQYLETLRTLIHEAQRRGIASKQVRESEQNLRRVVRQVLEGHDEPDRIGGARAAITESILLLRQALSTNER